MQVVVTAEHIALGEPKSPYTCPVALALRDAGLSAVVGDKELTMCSETWTLPAEAVLFTKEFDEELLVEPITFEIERKSRW